MEGFFYFYLEVFWGGDIRGRKFAHTLWLEWEKMI